MNINAILHTNIVEILVESGRACALDGRLIIHAIRVRGDNKPHITGLY